MIGAVTMLVLSCAASLDGDPAFQQAQALYKSLDYEQAILRFEEIAVRPTLSKADKAEALVWLGLSYAGTADFDSARRYLKDALESDDAVALPAQVSPRVAKLFADLQTEVRAEPKAPPPAAPQPPPPPAKATSSTGLMLGAVVGGVGALAIVGGAVCAGLAASNWGIATQPHQFQDTAKAALDATNTDLLAAAILAPSGVILAVVGGTLVAVNVE